MTTRRWRRRLALLLGATLAALVLAEVLLRVLGGGPPRTLAAGIVVADPDIGFRLAPNYDSDGSGGHSTFHVRTNERGYRDEPIGPKVAGRRRVLVLGDSFAYGMGVEVDQAFPRLLVKELAERGVDAEVINSGTPGYATHHEFHLLDRDGPELRPDDVVLAFYVGNDFRGNHTDRFGVMLVENGELIKRLPNAGAMQRAASFLVARSRLALLVARAFRPAADGAANGDVAIGCENADWEDGSSLAMARRTWDIDARAAERRTRSLRHG